MGQEADGTAKTLILQTDGAVVGLRPTAKFTAQCPGPLIVPSGASTLSVLPPGHPAQPSSMTATIDPDAVPGLREVFEAQRRRHALDTRTSWYTRSEEGAPPITILHVRFPEVDVAFNLVFDVMRFARQLIAAAASGRVTLIDPLLEQALRTDPLEVAMRDGLFVDLETPARETLVRILQQYFDLPLDALDESRLRCPCAESAEQMAAFAEGARVPAEYGVWTWPGTPPVLFFVDEDVAELTHELDGDETPVATWEVLRDDEHALARLDVHIGERRIASWLLIDPAVSVVRAAASGPHGVALLSEPPSADAPAREHYAAAAAAVVAVRTTSVAIRMLLAERVDEADEG